MQTYQAMQDSGVTYLGDIPDGWNLLRTSMLFKENKQSNNDLTSLEPMQFKLGEIINKQIDVDEKTKEEIKRYTVVEKDDIMVNGLNLNYDFLTQRVAIVRKKGCITPAYISLRTRTSILPMYACYLLKALDGQKVLNGWGTGIRLTLNFSEFKKYYLPAPSIDTQQKIINYLDAETALIDDLIAKQQQLLIILEEKRRATITAAVTRGLNPHVNLKDTGIEWIGQIPSHWKLKRLKYLFTINDEALGQKTNPETEFDYVDISSVDKYEGIINREHMTFANAPSRARRIVRDGDIVLGAVRTYLEAIAQITEKDADVIVSTGFAVLRPEHTSDSDFYAWAIRSSAFMASVVASSDGVSYPAINADKLAALFMPFPPKNEREAISNYIQAEMKKTDELKAKIFEQIDLLKERRISLISRVVTGKVKV